MFLAIQVWTRMYLIFYFAIIDNCVFTVFILIIYTR